MIGQRGPAFTFWLNYLEFQGGLWEQSGDTVLAMLPDRLRATHDLPESALMTDDPDIAREDGVLFLGAGNPEIHKGADAVVEAGDVGALTVPHSGKALGTDDVLAKIRDQVPVSHGRIDATGSALRSHRALLRLGALAGFNVSADEQFTEVVECLLDVVSRVAWTGDVAGRLRSAITSAISDPKSDPKPSATGNTLLAAAMAAHRELDTAAADRGRELAAGASAERAAELARASDYYDDALAAIDKRRGNADAQRLALLDARAAATVGERDRRLAEIEDKYRMSHELSYFRLHVVAIPVWRLIVDVRRGERRWPMTFDYLPLAGVVAPSRCPTCDSHAPLVAAKTHLGCTVCIVAHAPAPPVAEPIASKPVASKPIVPKPVAPKPQSTSKRSPRAALAKVARTPPATVPDPAAVSRNPFVPGKHETRKIVDFWQYVGDGETRKLSRLVAPESPLAALIRLYGAAGPLYGIGVGVGSVVVEFNHFHYDRPVAGERGGTGGELRAGGLDHPYLLLWTPDKLLDEIFPYSAPWHLGRMAGFRSFAAEVLPPREKLDDVARLLLRHTTRRYGLPFTARALAAWWRLPDHADLLGSFPAQALAAALDRAIRHWSGVPRAHYPDTAVEFRADEAQMRKATTTLQKRLALSPVRNW